MAVVDWTDPCARAAALREAYYSLLGGGQTIEFEYRSNETTRRVKYGTGNLTALARELARAEEECQALQGVSKPRRYAIRGGFFRRGDDAA